jgi:hypothetical protein
MIERVDSLLVVKAIADVLGTTGDENRAAELLSAWSVDIHKGAYRAGLNAANKEPITCPRCLSDNIDLSCGQCDWDGEINTRAHSGQDGSDA